MSFIDQFNSFWSSLTSLTSEWLQENPVLHIFNNCVAAILKFKMVDIVQKVGCCQFWKISVDFSLHHANIDTYIEKCIMLQWYINIIFFILTSYCVFPPLLNIGESCRNAVPLFHCNWFHNKKRPKRPSNWTFFFINLTLKQCPHEPFAPYLVIATPVNFLDGIFGYTSRLALHWYQICVVPFRAVKTGVSHGLNSKPSTYRPVNQLINWWVRWTKTSSTAKTI